jgi:hypothetical protein
MLIAAEEYTQAQLTRTPNRWCAPPIGSVKANWDVVIDKYYGGIGIGVVVRDSKGDIVVARSLTKYGFVEPLAGEIMAACVAVSLCLEMQGQVIIFEGDALQVVIAVNSEEQNWSRNGHLIGDMTMLLQSIPQYRCCHVYANNASHNLAKVAIYQIIDHTWKYVIPDYL